MSRAPRSDDELIVEVAIAGLPSNLFYLVPSDLNRIDLGWLVQVEVGNRLSSGWIVRVGNLAAFKSEFVDFSTGLARKSNSNQLNLLSDSGINKSPRLKSILSALPAFDPADFPLFQWMANYYGVSVAEVLDTAVPLTSAVLARLTKDATTKKPRARRAQTQPAPEIHPSFANVPTALTAGQQNAVVRINTAISAQEFNSFLLYGVTGSGKTEVYLRAISQTLERGGSALVVVPEIALTPQLIDLFQSRLQLELGVLHSELGPHERWKTWSNILSGSLRIAIGARSAVFAPLKDLSLIIVDEEHESSYKQSDSLRYHARDVAVMRAKFRSAPVVLGSATPSFESLLNAQRKRYRLLEMPERATTRPLPTIEVVDLSKIKKSEMPSPTLSPQLHGLIGETLAQGGQTIILYNRRGFSTYLQCTNCTEVLLCPHCSVPLTFHRNVSRCLCHYCEYSIAAPRYCSHCRNPTTIRLELDELSAAEREAYGLLEHRGAGTERVVQELTALYPTARIIQMDRDTVGKKESYRQILSAMRNGEADILVGTQMIAKGHDLPGVTLVGIVDADIGLHLPDFRASEKTFQLVTQASGRAGRGKDPGRVIIQTRAPNHPTIVATATGRFLAFARFEFERRQKLHYPPFGKLMRIVVSTTSANDVGSSALRVAAVLRELIQRGSSDSGPEHSDSPSTPPTIQLLGPAPAPLEKLRGRFRFHLLVKSPSASSLSRLAHELTAWYESGDQKKVFRMTVDIDPVDML